MQQITHMQWVIEGADYDREVNNVAPENHRAFVVDTDNTASVFCPWAYKRVHLSKNYLDVPVCNGCLRPVDVVKLGYSR